MRWLYTYRFLPFDMFVPYFVRLRTNHYTLLTISPILFIFDSARNLLYRSLWCFVKIPIAWREWRNARWEKWLASRFMKCNLYTSHFSHFANIFSRSCQFDNKCIADFRENVVQSVLVRILVVSLSECDHVWSRVWLRWCEREYRYVWKWVSMSVSLVVNSIEVMSMSMIAIVSIKWV